MHRNKKRRKVGSTKLVHFETKIIKTLRHAWDLPEVENAAVFDVIGRCHGGMDPLVGVQEAD
jgi:hypothetical protein